MAAMEQVDRALFVPAGSEADVDAPIPIGEGQTISAPHMHAVSLEMLDESTSDVTHFR